MKVHFKKVWEDIKSFGKRVGNKVSTKFNEYVDLEKEKDDDPIIILMDEHKQEVEEIQKEEYIPEKEIPMIKDEQIEEDIIEIKCPYCGSEHYKDLQVGTNPEMEEVTNLYLCQSCDETYNVTFKDEKIIKIEKSDNVILG